MKLFNKLTAASLLAASITPALAQEDSTAQTRIADACGSVQLYSDVSACREVLLIESGEIAHTLYKILTALENPADLSNAVNDAGMRANDSDICKNRVPAITMGDDDATLSAEVRIQFARSLAYGADCSQVYITELRALGDDTLNPVITIMEDINKGARDAAAKLTL